MPARAHQHAHTTHAFPLPTGGARPRPTRASRRRTHDTRDDWVWRGREPSGRLTCLRNASQVRKDLLAQPTQLRLAYERGDLPERAPRGFECPVKYPLSTR
jgi:hypothetical protein